ncbi:TetR/AcrR family transcriptional regulator [Loktanella sp. M215]|uniref:TetR/AcrR family transcriptional regulator n=1 Tax=Loktanella sp. M215 TaxID=2675431 RepID=UPI001F0043A2|nr:TetR/AcrR family transcriptional regulator [Loktanella sp. M215]MCF7702399.1 TetR family transcriptional regulator [Loktanella sp. M215]
MAQTTDSDETGDTPRRKWKQDPDGVRSDILRVAREVFAQKGLSGTRIDEIAARTSTSKRMIYYYFADKEGLYREVLADAYRQTREAEDALKLADMPPEIALRKLAEFTFDNHQRSQDFIRLVMIENVHEARHMPDASDMSGENSSAIRMLEDIYAQGLAQGTFRNGFTAVELHWHISALSYFNVSNRATFSHIFGDRLFDDAGQATLRQHVGDMILRLVMI